MSLPIMNVAIDFENNGTWTDVSAYLKNLAIKRGSSRVEGPSIRYEAGKCDLVFDNSDRRFDPTNLTGPYTIPTGGVGSGVQQAQATTTIDYGYGITVSVASTDPDVAEASLRDSTVITSGSTSFTCPKPAGTFSGDILVAFQADDWGVSTGIGNPTGGSSWGSAVISLTQGPYVFHTKVWIKTAGGSEPSTYGFTQPSGADGVVMIACIRDAALSYVTGTDINNGTAYFTTPSVTPVGTADLELRYVAGSVGGPTVTWDWTGTDGPYTEREDAQSSTFTTASLASKSLSGLVTATGGTLVKPMRPIRVRAIWNSVTYDLFRGYVDSWDITWNGSNWSEVAVPCTDAFKIFGNTERTAVAAVGAGEGTGTRIGRILDGIGWSASLRDIDPGDVTVISTTLEGNALEEMLLNTETEVGELYMTGDGKVFFRDRSGINDDARSTASNATFGDDGAGVELPYSDLTFTNEDAQLFNRVIVTRSGGATPQQADDTASQSEYLLHSFEKSDLLMQNDAAALNYAQYVLSLTSQPELRFDSMTISPHRDETNLFPQVLGRTIGDRITVRRRPPGGGSTIEQDCFIRGIEHTVNPSQWQTSRTLQSTSAAGALVIIGDTTRGRLDNNPLGF